MPFGSRRCVGVYMNYPETAHYQVEFLRGLDRVAQEQDINVLVFGIGNMTSDHQNQDPGMMLLEHARGKLLDGIIFLTGSFAQAVDQSRMQELLALHPGLPMVSVGDTIEGVPNVLLDSLGGLELVLDHLFGYHSYRNPAFISGPRESYDAKIRLAGFKQALEKHGIPFSEDRVYYGDFTFESGGAAADYFFASGECTPDVFVCANDNMAIGLRQRVRTCNYQSLTTLAVTGFDDVPLSDWFENPLTTVHQELEGCGVKAMELILEQLDAAVLTQVNHFLPTFPVYRYSCGCQPEQFPGSIAASNHVQNVIFDGLIRSENLRNNETAYSRFARECLKNSDINPRRDQIAPIVQRLGVGTFYIITFTDHSKPLSGDALVKIAWDNGHMIPSTSGPVRYQALDFLPYGYHPQNRVTLLVNVLEDLQNCSGMLIVEYGVQLQSLNSFKHHLAEAIMALNVATELRDLNDQLERAKGQLEQLSQTDELTGLLNRRGFLTLARQEALLCRRQKEGFWILFIDVDGLKLINDRYGHAEGDEAIRLLGEVIRTTVRMSDICARIGGDEFTVLVANSSRESLLPLLNRLDELVAKENNSKKHPWILSFSIGDAYSEPDSSLDVEALMDLADTRLYEDKRRKKNFRRPE